VLKGNGRCGHKCGSCDCVLRKFQEGRHGLVHFLYFSGVFLSKPPQPQPPLKIHRSYRFYVARPSLPVQSFSPSANRVGTGCHSAPTAPSLTHVATFCFGIFVTQQTVVASK